MTLDQERWNARVATARDEELQSRKGYWISPAKRQPRHPFKRAAKLYTEIINLRASMQNNLTGLQLALSEFPPYVSRGHGWKGRVTNRLIGGQWSHDRSKYSPHQGRSEAARRVYQRLTPYQCKLAREIAAEELERAS